MGALRIIAVVAAASAAAAVTAESTATAASATTAEATAIAAAAPATRRLTAPWRAHIEEASKRFGVPVPWIERVMIAESGGRTIWNGRPTVSHAGAMGLMQLMPATWIDMRRRLGLGHDPHAPRDNILAGTLYLRLMHDRFGYPGLFAAYNAGPTRYAAFLEGRRSLPRETRDYLRKVAQTLPPARGVSKHLVAEPRARSPGPEVQTSQPDLFFIRR